MAKGKIDWEKRGAIAGIVSAVIAVPALVVAVVALSPPQPSPPGPSHSPTYSSLPPDPPTTPPPPAPSQTVAMPRVMPAGCADGLAAVKTYNRTVGSTRTSQAAAANQAYGDMMGADTEATGSVYTVLVALARDFQNLSAIASGMLDQDYSEAAARTRDDVRTLDSVCTPS